MAEPKKRKAKPQKVQTPVCIFCGGANSAERVEIGRPWCMARDCVARWVREKHADMRVALIPKSGFTLLHKDDRFFRTGKSSGKT